MFRLLSRKGVNVTIVAKWVVLWRKRLNRAMETAGQEHQVLTLTTAA
jgi:hypothetical protein